MGRETILYRADEPEKGKIRVWKSIKRVVRDTDYYSYVLWRGHKWRVTEHEGTWYLRYQVR